MEWFQVALLALMQGITEFLPISSSAHLILPKEILGWPDQGLAFDVAVHVGSLAAVVIYFRDDIRRLIVAWFAGLGGNSSADSRLAWYVIWGTVPAGLAGLLFNDFIEAHLRSTVVIMMTTLVFGLLLGVGDKFGARQKSLAELTLGMVLLIGVAQALALIPGTSRSGITITAALALGFRREDAARFSFLLSIPVILGAGLLKTKDLLESTVPVDWGHMALGVVVSAVTAYLTIMLFLRLLDWVGMLPFMLYRLLLGAVLFVWFV